ncbi:MAG: hypothetical protein ACYCPF_22335, partial [Streptosporangiaceae bacterium]
MTHSTRNLALPRPAWPRGWRAATGLIAVAAGATIVAGALLPWVSEFGGLIPIPGIRGGNGRLMAAAGVLLATAGLYHLAREGRGARWVIGLAGFVALGFSGFLLIRLIAAESGTGGNSMVAISGGHGLWVTAAGSAAAFATLIMPPSSQTTLRRPGAGRPAAWAADPASGGARRWLRIALGLSWLADGLLQLQPSMFTSAFVSSVLAPAAMGNPAPVAGLITAASRAIGPHVAVWNAAFAGVQLAIGAGLLWRRTGRAALAGSVLWGLAVWVIGEGLGGLLTGTASPLTGSPGAALLYAITAVLLWPASGHDRGGDRSVAGASPLGPIRSRLVWVALWGGFAVQMWQPAVRAATGTPLAVAATAAFAAISAGIALPGAVRITVLAAAAGALAIWAAA